MPSSWVLRPTLDEKDNAMMDQFAPILRKGLRSLIWVLGLIMALNNAGYDVGALLAGVGIGGLAMATAAKDFVSNIFGGITVFVDKPFQVGDRIQIGGYDGTIEEIGIRSTRACALWRVAWWSSPISNSPTASSRMSPSNRRARCR